MSHVPDGTETPVRILMPARVPEDLRAVAVAAAAAGGRAAELLLYHDRQEFAARLPLAEVSYAAALRAEDIPSAPRLRWMHLTSAGVDRLPLRSLAEAGTIVTNARGQHADTMADHAFGLLLALSRNIAASVRDQAASRWARHAASPTPAELSGRRLGILGFGAIGRAIAKRAQAFGMDVWASRRRTREDDPAPPGVSRILGPSRAEFLEILGACDDIVSVLPSTERTRGLFDAAAFSAMRPGARFLNIGRGDVLEEEALDAALRSGLLAGAGCDCLPREPLPPDAALWGAPNLVITPHIGGMHPNYERRAMATFSANLTRYCRDEPLENLVDLQEGY